MHYWVLLEWHPLRPLHAWLRHLLQCPKLHSLPTLLVHFDLGIIPFLLTLPRPLPLMPQRIMLEV